MKVYWIPLAGILLLAPLFAALSDAGAFFAGFIQGEALAGEPLYTVAGHVVTDSVVRKELDTSMTAEFGLSEEQRKNLAENPEFRELYMESRLVSDLFMHEARAEGMFRDEAFLLYLRTNLRELVKNYYIMEKMPEFTVSDAELEAFYDAHVDELGGYSWNDIQRAIRTRLLQVRRQEFLGATIESLREKYGAVVHKTNY
jgi:hypothetical protein